MVALAPGVPPGVAGNGFTVAAVASVSFSQEAFGRVGGVDLEPGRIGLA